MFLVDLAYVLMIIVYIVNIPKAKENLLTTFLEITIYINCYHDMTCNQILCLLIREVWIKDAKTRKFGVLSSTNDVHHHLSSIYHEEEI